MLIRNYDVNKFPVTRSIGFIGVCVSRCPDRGCPVLSVTRDGDDVN
jgi:hypothetical protein